MKQSIVCIAHDIRSAHNVGSLLRTCEGLGIDMLYFTGFTPYPVAELDSRLPHESRKIHAQITKTALGAETSMRWRQVSNINSLFDELTQSGYTLVALEQAKNSIPLPQFMSTENVALLLGREVEGIDPDLLGRCDAVVEIPMFGNKESYNVVQAAAMALYHIRFLA